MAYQRILLVLLMIYYGVDSKISQWTTIYAKANSGAYSVFPNSMYKGAAVDVQIICSSPSSNRAIAANRVKVTWILQELECMEDLYSTKTNIQVQDHILSDVTYDQLQKTSSSPGSGHPHVRRSVSPRKEANLNRSSSETSKPKQATGGGNVHVFKFQVSEAQTYPCSDNNIITLQDESASPYYIGYLDPDIPNDEPGRLSWTRQSSPWTKVSQSSGHVTKAWEDGMYQFLLNISPLDGNLNFTATVSVRMKGDLGYLPAIQWPLLPVRGVLSCLYLVIGTVWVLIWARSHQHTLKIHIVIGAVAVAAALANVLNFVELSSSNSTGNGVLGLKWLSIFLAVLQSSLVNLVLMIVSTGYGITRPEFSWNIVTTAACLSSLAAISNFLSYVVLDEDLKIKYNLPLVAMAVNAVYCVFMLVLGAWIMIYSILTFIHLGKRKHSTKKVKSFTLFTVTCVIVFLVNLALSVVGMGFTRQCARAWQLEWLLSSYSAMTTFVLLVVLMWLWRPVDEAQSYAFTPLNTDDTGIYDGESEEEVELNSYDKLVLEPISS